MLLTKHDNVTFTNTTGQPQPVTVRFVIHGGLSAGAMYSNDGTTLLYYGRARARSHLTFFGNGGQGGEVDGDFGVDSDPANPHNNFGGITQSAWNQTASPLRLRWIPNNQSGTFAVLQLFPAGELTVLFNAVSGCQVRVGSQTTRTRLDCRSSCRRV